MDRQNRKIGGKGSDDSQQRKKNSQTCDDCCCYCSPDKDPIVILRRLRQKIDAIRVLDPYYETKLTQLELDKFMQSRDALQKEIIERERRKTIEKSEFDKSGSHDKGKRRKSAKPAKYSDDVDYDDYEHPSGMSFAQFRTLLTNCSSNPAGNSFCDSPEANCRYC